MGDCKHKVQTTMPGSRGDEKEETAKQDTIFEIENAILAWS